MGAQEDEHAGVDDAEDSLDAGRYGGPFLLAMMMRW